MFAQTVCSHASRTVCCLVALRQPAFIVEAAFREGVIVTVRIFHLDHMNVHMRAIALLLSYIIKQYIGWANRENTDNHLIKY